MHSLGIVQWDSTRRDHPGYPGRVSGTGPVRNSPILETYLLQCQIEYQKKKELSKNLDEITPYSIDAMDEQQLACNGGGGGGKKTGAKIKYSNTAVQDCDN